VARLLRLGLPPLEEPLLDPDSILALALLGSIRLDGHQPSGDYGVNSDMQSTFRRALVLALVMATGCGTESPPPAVDVTGTWVGSVDSNTGPPGFAPVFGTYTLTLQLVQDGSHVTGALIGAFSGTIAGGVSGDRANLTVTVAPCGGPGNLATTVNLTGTVQNTFSGIPLMNITYEGKPCGVVDYGTGTLRQP
jgi:hypothetical protein